MVGFRAGNSTANSQPAGGPQKPPRLGEHQAGVACESNSDTFRLLLLLSLDAGDGAAGGAADLGNDAFFLVFRQVFDQEVVGLLQCGVAADLFQDAFPDALLAVQFARLVEDAAAFEPFTRDGLDVAPILRVL